MLTIVDSNKNNMGFFSCWFHQVALFSMYPLLSKDGLDIPYIIAMVIGAIYTLDFTCGPTCHHTHLKKCAFIVFILIYFCFIFKFIFWGFSGPFLFTFTLSKI
eukprot:Phypoly_transcript_19530.p1 GENE.Phypoly_transcript_19530~~Phypoly_transcript_19530.p1  ORF type:complete len:103 (+),score=0.50 Phypoly_transcript_19530:138-446(+)